MNLKQINKVFTTEKKCIEYLEKIIWNNKPICPYCKSYSHTVIKNSNRYHCNGCNNTYSVTVGTVLHKTKVDIRKWFVIIDGILKNDLDSIRDVAKKINVTKDTAWLMIQKSKNAMFNQKDLIEKIFNNLQTSLK